MKCEKHPEYKGKGRAACPTCLRIYQIELQYKTNRDVERLPVVGDKYNLRIKKPSW